MEPTKQNQNQRKLEDLALAKRATKKVLDVPNIKPVTDPKSPEARKLFRTEDKAQRVHDGFDNFLTRVGLNNDNPLSGGMYTFNLMTRNRIQLEAAYRGSWIVGQVVDCVADDMTRAGLEITTNEGDQDIKDVQAAISRLQLWDSLNSNIKWGRLYGGSIAVLQIDGQDLATPLDVATVGQGQFKGLVVFDRWQLNPDIQGVIQKGPDMGLPMYYNIVNDPRQVDPTNPTPTGQLKVHYSRIIRHGGIDLPFFQAITEQMWGESELERLWDRLIAFDEATMSTGQLIDRAVLRTVKIDGLREIVAAGGKAQQGLEAQFNMMRLMQTNEGLTLLDKNDEFASTSYSFAGLSDVLIQMAQQLSGSSQIPLVRLFGQSPAGLNSTGESDIRMYYDSIKAKQEAKLRQGWTLLLKVLWRSVYGKDAPKDLEFEFTPLWQMSLLDRANLAKTQTEAIIGAYEAGLNDRPTSMKELRQQSGDTGLFSNITDKQIKEAEEEPVPLPGGETGLELAEPKLDKTGDPVKNIDQMSTYEKIKSWLKPKRSLK